MRAPAVVCLLAAPAAAQTETVTGTVRLAGEAPRLKPQAIAKDSAVCGREAAVEAPLVGPGGALGNVVVSLRGAKPERPPAATPNAAIDQVGCRYKPHVQAVTVGTTMAVLNNDAVFHNVHAVGGGVTVFNVAMPFKGQRLPTVLRKPGIMKLRCDAGHTWMSAWVHVFEHPWFAVTDARGAFTIKDVPPGKYTVEFWHEPLDDERPAVVKTATVEVAPGKAATADASLAL